MFTRALLLILTTSSLAQAAELLRIGKDNVNIAVSHDAARQWAPRDRACVLQHGREIACGTVVKVSPKGAIVRLDAANYDVLAGDRVTGKGKAQGRDMSSVETPAMNSVATHAADEALTLDLSVGAFMGLSFVAPSISLAYAFNPHWAVGISGFFFSKTSATNTNTSTSSMGGLASIHYYSAGTFRGIWGQVGAGMTTFSTSTSGTLNESGAALFGLGTVGYRHHFSQGLNVGGGVGGQFYLDPGFATEGAIDSMGFAPIATLDVSWNF